MRYYTDGSSTIGVKSAYCVTDENGKVVEYIESVMPSYTNNEEEYHGVIAALYLAKTGDEVYTDSLLVVNQIKGMYAVKKPHLKALCDEAKRLQREKQVPVTWISREENLAGKKFKK